MEKENHGTWMSCGVVVQGEAEGEVRTEVCDTRDAVRKVKEIQEEVSGWLAGATN